MIIPIATDINGAISDPATVNVTVIGQNDAPVVYNVGVNANVLSQSETVLVLQEEINYTNEDNTQVSINRHDFTHNGGILTLDILTEAKTEEFPDYWGITADGVQTSLDPYIYLLDASGNVIAFNDDKGELQISYDGSYHILDGDGSMSDRDSYIQLDADAGQYTVVVSGFRLTQVELNSNINYLDLDLEDYNDGVMQPVGAYELTISSDSGVDLVNNNDFRQDNVYFGAFKSYDAEGDSVSYHIEKIEKDGDLVSEDDYSLFLNQDTGTFRLELMNVLNGSSEIEVEYYAQDDSGLISNKSTVTMIANDSIDYNDSAVDGGFGYDTLFFDSDIDMAELLSNAGNTQENPHITSIEEIDLSNHILSNLSIEDFLTITEGNDELRISASDIDLGSDWSSNDGGTTWQNNTSFEGTTYSASAQSLTILFDDSDPIIT